MNCPFKKTHSRILSLVCVLILLIGLLSGCSFGKDDPSGDTQGTPNLNLVDPDSTGEATDPSDSTDPESDKNMGVTTQQVNVYSTASETGNVIGYLDEGTEVEILQVVTVGGTSWGLVRQGWICLNYVETDYVPESSTGETTPEETTPEETTANTNLKGVVTADLNIRKEATAESEKVGSYQKGDVISILETKDGWGRTSKGWVSMEYVQTSADGDNTSDDKQNNDTTTTSIKGTVTVKELNIRKEASSDSDRVGSYVKGDSVTILETKNGWGRTDKGWISMQYVSTSSDTTNNDTTTTTTNGTKAVVTVNELNIRDEASTSGNRVGSYTYGARITVLETKNGWGRTDKGWVSLSYVYQDGTSGNNSCKGIVTGTQLNVRSGPGTGYDKVKSLNYGARVTVLERIKIDGTTWGCIDGGWISMDYIYVDGTTGTGSGTGTVTGEGLNIRSGPGTGFGSVGSLSKGETIKIYAQFKIDDMTWGCTDKGWVSMSYVDMND